MTSDSSTWAADLRAGREVVITESVARLLGAHVLGILVLLAGVVGLLDQPKPVAVFLFGAMTVGGAWTLITLVRSLLGRQSITLDAAGIHSRGRLVPWPAIMRVELGNRDFKGAPYRRWVRLGLAPGEARHLLGSAEGISSLMDEMTEDMNQRLGGVTWVDLPFGLPDPSELERVITRQAGRRTPR